MIKKEMSYEKMTVIELKKLCGNLKISVTNKKKIELIAMLIEHDKRISEKIINEEKINEERLNEERLNEENEKQMRCEKAIDVKTKDERGGICTVQIHNEDTKQEKSTTENLQENTDVNVNDATTSVNSIKIVTNILVNDINFFEQNKNNNEIGMKKLENKTKSYEKHLNEELEEGEIYKRKRVKTNEYEKEYKILYKLTDNNLQKLANMSEAERIEARKKGLHQTTTLIKSNKSQNLNLIIYHIYKNVMYYKKQHLKSGKKWYERNYAQVKPFCGYLIYLLVKI